MLRSLARRARIPTLAALALGLLAVPAPAATVIGGSLDWTMDNFYASGDPARTWLGYVTQGPGSFGSAIASGDATITDRTGANIGEVTPASPTGLGEDYTLSFPATGGTYDEYTGTGTVALGGTITFTPHGIPYTIVNPTVTLDGTSGSLAASGEARAAYGPDAPIFTFDLTSSLVTLKANGTRVIDAMARTGFGEFFFGRSYLPSQGTEEFALRLRLKPDEVGGPAGPKGETGAKGEKGENGARGPKGADGRIVRIQTSALRRAPFGGTRQKVKVLRVKRKGVVAQGSVRGSTIRVRLAQDFKGKRLKGVYRLKVAGKPAKRVRVL